MHAGEPCPSSCRSFCQYDVHVTLRVESACRVSRVSASASPNWTASGNARVIDSATPVVVNLLPRCNPRHQSACAENMRGPWSLVGLSVLLLTPVASYNRCELRITANAGSNSGMVQIGDLNLYDASGSAISAVPDSTVVNGCSSPPGEDASNAFDVPFQGLEPWCFARALKDHSFAPVCGRQAAQPSGFAKTAHHGSCPSRSRRPPHHTRTRSPAQMTTRVVIPPAGCSPVRTVRTPMKLSIPSQATTSRALALSQATAPSRSRRQQQRQRHSTPTASC